MSRSCSSPSVAFESNIAVDLGNKCMIQFIDIGSNLAYSRIRLIRGNSDFVFYPENQTYIVLNSSGANLKRLQISGRAYGV